MSTNQKPFVYLVTSLASDTPEAERAFLRQLVDYLRLRVNLLPWTFDLYSWEYKSVPSVYHFEMTQIRFASFVGGVFSSSTGSDGRGVLLHSKIVDDTDSSVCFYGREGINVSGFIQHLIRDYNVSRRFFGNMKAPMYELHVIKELGDMILMDAKRKTEMFIKAEDHRRQAIEQLDDPKKTYYCKEATRAMMALQS